MGSVQIVLYGGLSTDCGYLWLKERVSYDREGHFLGYHFRLQYLNNFILLLIFDIKFGILLLRFSCRAKKTRPIQVLLSKALFLSQLQRNIMALCFSVINIVE